MTSGLSRVPDQPGPADAELCVRYRSRLVGWLTTVFGPRDAEDIAQEALARLYAHRAELLPDADVWPWLAVVARNIGRDLARHNAFSTTLDTATLAALPGSGDVAAEVVSRDDAALVNRALAKLSRRERTVIQLRDFDGAPIADIAELLGITENAARQLLFRARRRLAQTYTKMGGERLGLAGAVARLREAARDAARRYAAFVDEIAASSAALFSGAGGAAAVAIGGLVTGLLPGGGPPPAAVAVAAVAPPDPVNWRDATRIVTVPAVAPIAQVARRALPSDPPPVLVERHDTVGPVATDLRLHDQTSGNEGETEYERIWVTLPDGSGFGIENKEEKQPGHGPVCRLLNCP